MRLIIKLAYFTVLMILSSFHVSAQDKMSLLKTELAKAKNDSAKLRAYEKIFKHYEFASNDSAGWWLDEAAKSFAKSGFTYGEARMLGFLGNEYSKHGDMDEARKQLSRAKSLFQKIDNKDGIAIATNGMGIVEGRSGNYDKAAQHFMFALKTYESIPDTGGIVNTYIKLGAVNELTNNHPKALEYYKKGIALADSNGMRSSLATLHNNMGIIYLKDEQYKEGIPYFLKAVQLSNRPDLAQVRMLPLTNLGNTYHELNDDKKALEYYNQALDITATSNMPEDHARLLIDVAGIKGKTDPKEALRILDECLATARQLDQKALASDVLDQVIAIHKRQGDYPKALAAFELQQGIKDSLYQMDKIREISSLQATHDLEKSKQRILQLQQTEKENDRERMLFVVVALTLIILLAIVTFYYRKSKRLISDLSIRETELARANTDKDRMFSVIGHDLKGPIGNIPVMMDFLEEPGLDPDEAVFIRKSIREAATAAAETLDKLLNWGKAQIKGVSIKPRIFDAYQHLQTTIALQKPFAEQKNQTIEVDIDQTIKVFADIDHFSFIMRNLLSNAIKFSRTNSSIRINAEMESGTDYVIFSVADSGVGMDEQQQRKIFELSNVSSEGTANEKGNSLGLILCREYVEQNGGRIWVESTIGKGSTFYFVLKLG